MSPSAKSKTKSKEKRVSVSIDVVPVPSTDSVEWKSTKRITSGVPQSKDKLMSEGWSVPVTETVRDLSVTNAGACLTSTSEDRKAMT